jgi:DNA modification methylase
MTVRILIGDVRDRLRELPDESVHCVVTSPPYWALRDYGTPGQLGLEPTPQEHVAVMVDVFREVRRVLRSDGVCWVNYGDSYANSVNGTNAAETKARGKDDRTFRDKPLSSVAGGLKPKDLCMVPARFALAMQDDGWWLRSMLPWVKRNGMPESISDRPATSIEYVFMFTKSARYWYDDESVRLWTSPNTNLRVSQDVASQIGSMRANGGAKTNGPMKAVTRRSNKHAAIVGQQDPARARRTAGFDDRWDERERKVAAVGSGVKNNDSFQESVALPINERNFRNSDLFWPSLVQPLGLISDECGAPLALDVAPQSFREAHFATFPPNLIRPLILAGCPKGGLVLDPFGGAGTTGLVADRLKREAILIELNARYAQIARKRIQGDAPMFVDVQMSERAA